MTKKLLLTFALLCAVAQGVWAGERDDVYIRSASDLIHVRNNWGSYCNSNIYLEADLDMGYWTSMGNNGGSITEFKGVFYGNGHTIRFDITGYSDYQGFIARIGSGGRVQDLHVSGSISSNERLVGGIAGENQGTIINCWVSANVSSSWTSGSSYTAKVGGITGENNAGVVYYCCMSGNVENHDADVGGLVGYSSANSAIEHCTFYGNRWSSHSQDNIYVGDNRGRLYA